MESNLEPSDKRRRRKKRLTSVVMEFFIRTAIYKLFDHKSNEEILEYLIIKPGDEKLRRCTSNWLRHVTRMNNNRMRTAMLTYRKYGSRRLGRPLKRILDESEIGLSRLNS